MSSRWTEDMDSVEHNNIYIKELGCTMGSAWGNLKYSWKALKRALREGDYQRVEELKTKIHRYRKYMGIPNDELY
jgi:hypothetical protein